MCLLFVFVAVPQISQGDSDILFENDETLMQEIGGGNIQLKLLIEFILIAE